MGYLTDNITAGRNSAVCQDLYPFRIIAQPGFLSDSKISFIVKDEIPDIEEWQFSGRRQCPTVPSRGRSRPIRRVIHPSAYAQNSRLVRPFTEEVIYAFRSMGQQTQVSARFTQERISHRLEEEPGNGQIIIVVP